MTDEEAINDDDVEEPLDDDETEDLDGEGGDSDETSASSSKSAPEVIEDFSIASRQQARNELEEQIAAFLARGGTITEVPANVTADPPKKPVPDYGGRPI